ncbi:MAG: FAD binding domain-containing protein, partial [Gemmatimonadota bacterium]
MKPAPFEYVRPASVAEAIEAIASGGYAARALAGGQSLIPAMNFRLAQPSVLVDLGPLEDLRGIRLDGDRLRIGAMTRQRDVERSVVVRDHAPLLAEVMPWIAHPQIRNRGTIGGSLAHADPAAELPAVMLVLGATLTAQGPSGARRIPAAEFYTGLFETALEPDEILTEIDVPVRTSATRWAFEEVSRRHGDFA